MIPVDSVTRVGGLLRFGARVTTVLTSLTTLLCGPALGLNSVAATSGSTESGTNLPSQNGVTPSGSRPVLQRAFIREYRVEGAHKLTRLEIEEAVYPFLGPGRTLEDVEQARSSLERRYRDKGYQTVSVQVASQPSANGVVVLQVTEMSVGRLRVKGSRYFSPGEIKREAPSLAEGKVPNFGDVTRDIVGLNQLPERRVTPELRAGGDPGTVDIDLNVTDTFPLHGTLELNNRYSPGTTELRLNGSVSYNNLWQLGHSIGASFQIAPERLDDAKVFSAYYLARIPEVSWLSVIAQGTKQDSNVSTLGGTGVAGRGEVVGARAIMALPAGKDFYHSLTLGFDYKHFDQDLTIAGVTIPTPITYYPLSLNYNATWANKGAVTVLNAGLTFGSRGLGSDEAEFDLNRFKAGGSFFYFRGDLSHTHSLPGGFELFGKVQGQAADQALVSSEQFNGGGLATVRGYLESEVLGDNALLGSVELRSPSLLGKSTDSDEWRFYVFSEGGIITLEEALPEQESRFYLSSVGVGSRIRLRDHFNGSLDLGLPLNDQTETKALDLLLTFRVWADF
jgi:hemolysin activation/secretion protein